MPIPLPCLLACLPAWLYILLYVTPTRCFLFGLDWIHSRHAPVAALHAVIIHHTCSLSLPILAHLAHLPPTAGLPLLFCPAYPRLLDSRNNVEEGPQDGTPRGTPPSNLPVWPASHVPVATFALLARASQHPNLHASSVLRRLLTMSCPS